MIWLFGCLDEQFGTSLADTFERFIAAGHHGGTRFLDTSGARCETPIHHPFASTLALAVQLTWMAEPEISLVGHVNEWCARVQQRYLRSDRARSPLSRISHPHS